MDFKSCSVVGFPLYRVGADCSVWSLWTRGKSTVGNVWRQLKPRCRKDSRKIVTLIAGDGSSKTFLVARLMLYCFKGPPSSDKPECRHLNGNPADDRPENLEWGNRVEQYEDMVRHGTFRYITPDNRGENCGAAKLTEAMVKSIREEVKTTKITHQALAFQYGVSRQTISDAVSGRTWGHL